jgi:heme A synthase
MSNTFFQDLKYFSLHIRVKFCIIKINKLNSENISSMDQQQIAPQTMLWLSFASLVLLYSVMMIGVYISASNLGLFCTEWPLCPNGFNFPPPKYFFEHYHRVLVVITGVFIYTTAAYTIKNAKSIRKYAIASSIIISFQMLLGMLVVNTNLQPLLVAIHLSTGVLLFAMTLMTFLSAYKVTEKKSAI